MDKNSDYFISDSDTSTYYAYDVFSLYLVSTYLHIQVDIEYRNSNMISFAYSMVY